MLLNIIIDLNGFGRVSNICILLIYEIWPKLKYLFSGIDPLLWQQAKLDNPDPDRYIPVPMIGFKELQRRLRHQAEQTKAYQQRMDVRTTV